MTTEEVTGYGGDFLVMGIEPSEPKVVRTDGFYTFLRNRLKNFMTK